MEGKSMTLAMAITLGWLLFAAELVVLGWLLLRARK
jgi:hypothetical protein